MLPQQFLQIKLPVKLYLSSYRACNDCKYAINKLKNESVSFLVWKVEWAGICSLLKASIHLMRNKDAKSCMPDALKKNLINVWHQLGKEKDEYPLYWEFVHKERNNILKQYEFSAYDAFISEDGTIRRNHTLLSIMTEGEKQTLLIRGGYYDGQKALEVAGEAADWIESILLQAIKDSGYDPEQEVISESFILPTAPQNNASGLLSYNP